MAEVMAWPLNLAEYAYNAEDVQRWMAGKTSGVYGAEGNWQVAAAGGMNLTVKATDQLGGWLSNLGRHGVVFWNGADIQLTVPTADGTLPRVDRVVVSWHIPQQSSVPVVEVRKGTPASNPVGPALVNDGEYAEICLAEINLAAGQTEITADNIIDTRLNTELCGLVSAGLDKYPTDGLEAEFRAWFDALKTDLDGDVAANLLSNIETHKADTEVHLRRLEYTKSGTTHQLTGLTTVSGVVSCVFTATADFAAGDTVTVDGESYEIKLSNGETPQNNLFVAEAVISVIIDKTSKKVNFKSGGLSKSLITEVVESTKNWTNPSYNSKPVMVMVAGGGGGGATYNMFGGNSGEIKFETVTLAPGEEVVCTIGKGGTSNGNGGASSFGSYVSAAGGAKGTSAKHGMGSYFGGAPGKGLGNAMSPGKYGGAGGKASGASEPVRGSNGTNTIGMGLEFEGEGLAGNVGTTTNYPSNKRPDSFGGSSGNGGYGGNGGNGGNGGHLSSGSNPKENFTSRGGYGGPGGGGGYGGRGGNGGAGGDSGKDSASHVGGNGGNGGPGGGGGYGAAGGLGGIGGIGGSGKPYADGKDGGDGGEGGGGGYGPNGNGGTGGAGMYAETESTYNGLDGGIAAGGGGSSGTGGKGGKGLIVIQYWGFK